MLVSLLAPRLGLLGARLIAWVGIPLLLAVFIWWRVDAYGDRRYRQGGAATDAKWEEASLKLQSRARESATRADDAAADRLVEHVQQVTQEQEQINEAIENGSSPLDVLFGG